VDHQGFACGQNSVFLAPYCRSVFAYYRSEWHLPCLAEKHHYLLSALQQKYLEHLVMDRTIAATLLFSTLGVGVVLAQTTTSPSSTDPAVTTNSANTTAAAPVAGANSFTMAQAQKRLEDQGYTQVSALAKDEKPIWRGHAMKNGKAVDVALDYQGNITAN
jgi:hypothetical protein